MWSLKNPYGWEFEPGNSDFTSWSKDLLSFALIGHLKTVRYFLFNKMDVLQLEYHMYTSYGEFKINKIQHL